MRNGPPNFANDPAERNSMIRPRDGADTRPDTIKRAAEKIRTARFKVEAYAALLGDQKARLETSLAAAAERLRAKVAEIGKPTPAAGGGGSTAAEVPAGVAARTQGPNLFDAVEV